MAKVLTLGTFDTLHPGHVYLLEQCRKIAGDTGEVVVAANTSEFVLKFKGRAPVQTTEERVTMLAAIQYVDEVVVNDGQDAKPVIDDVEPDFIVIGSDWSGTRPDGTTYYDQLQVTARYLDAQRIAILYLDRMHPQSSTELKERVRGA